MTIFCKYTPKLHSSSSKNHNGRLVHARITQILEEESMQVGEDSYNVVKRMLKNDHSRVRSKSIKVPYFWQRIDLITHIPNMRASIFEGVHPGELLMKNQEETVKTTASGEGDVPEFKCSFEIAAAEKKTLYVPNCSQLLLNSVIDIFD